MSESESWTLADLVLARADDERVGMQFEDDEWTWREHVQLAADRAAWLRSLRRDGPFHVGVLMENVPEFSFLLTGAALAGAVIVGLNTTRRGAELARDMERTDCQLVVTEQKFAPALTDLELPVDADRLVVADDASYVGAAADFAGAPVIAPSGGDESDLFMLIFTSGTSGDPKAVRMTHRKLAPTGPGPSPFLGRDEIAYLSMPMFHSACMIQGWTAALASGARMVLKRRFSASGWLPDVRRYGVTYFHYVGKPLAYILATPEQPDDADNPLKLAIGNEAAPLDIPRFAQRFGCDVRDGFGSTETGISVGRTPDTPAGSIGRLPEGGAILDPETWEPVPPARFDDQGRLLNFEEAVGELVNTLGPGLFAGYYNDEQADADRMRGGMYWSGDLAYQDDRGFVYFAGRSIEWLRVGGENLGVAPIERILARFPRVALVAVYAVPDVQVGDQIMAALQLEPSASFDPVAFADFLREQPDLGTVWSPRFVRVSTGLPVTETNKVLKRVLARECWEVDDPIWIRDGDAYRPMTDDDRAGLRDALAEHGRAHLIPAPGSSRTG
jgi:fatty-acyl-CoA synthase